MLKKIWRWLNDESRNWQIWDHQEMLHRRWKNEQLMQEDLPPIHGVRRNERGEWEKF